MLADQYPQNESSANRPAIDDKDNTGYYFKVLDTIVYKHFFKLKFHPIAYKNVPVKVIYH